MAVVLLVIMPGTWLISGLIVDAFFGVPWRIGMVVERFSRRLSFTEHERTERF